MKKYNCIFYIIALLLTSCTWDSILYKQYVTNEGTLNECKDLHEIVLDNGSVCKKGLCDNFAEAFEYNICPVQYPMCSDGVCSRCTGGLIYCNGSCVSPKYDVNFCGAVGDCNNDDIESPDFKGHKCADKEYCKDGVCVPTCTDEQHLDPNSNKCVADSVLACPVSGNITNCEELDGWLDGACKDNRCEPSQCKEQYFLANGKCYKNADEQCGALNINCKQLEGCKNNGTCDANNSKCECAKCDLGYHLHYGHCEIDSISDCGEHKGEKFTACADNEFCNNGKCGSDCTIQCKINSSSECIDNIVDSSNEHCGACNNSCTDENYLNSIHASEAKCENRKCAPKKCAVGYHFDSEGVCLPDDIDNCGAHGRNCADIVEHWYTGVCENSDCIVRSCEDGYKIVDGNCVKGSTGSKNTCCEDIPYLVDGVCNNNGSKATCTISKCREGFTVEVNNNSGQYCTPRYSCEFHWYVLWYAYDRPKNAPEVVNGLCKEYSKSFLEHKAVYVATECQSGYLLKNGVCDKI